MNVACPLCQFEMASPDELAGQLVECPHCRGHIQLPQPSTIAVAVAEHSAGHPAAVEARSVSLPEIHVTENRRASKRKRRAKWPFWLIPAVVYICVIASRLTTSSRDGNPSAPQAVDGKVTTGDPLETVSRRHSVVGRWRTEDTGQFRRKNQLPTFTIHEFDADGSYSHMYNNMNAGLVPVDGATVVATGVGTWQRNGDVLTFTAFIRRGVTNLSGRVEQNPVTGEFYNTGPRVDEEAYQMSHRCRIISVTGTTMELDCSLSDTTGFRNRYRVRLIRVK